ncbi:MAG: AraC family transcriptional regulator [Actinobacteria bacterium]|nr:AraC family transcriptional regulator [Actinomycetota bacterium]
MHQRGTEAQAALETLADLTLGRLATVGGEPRMARPHDGLLLLSNQRPSDHLAQVYDPVVCLVLQGAKEVTGTHSSYVISAGQLLVVTHDMPVVSRITEASPQVPYVAAILSLDRDTLADLGRHAPPAPPVGLGDHHALRAGDASPELLDAFLRAVRTLDSPADSDVLLPLAAREIHYRLLQSPPGQALRRLGNGHRPGEPVARAIGLIRGDLSAKLSIRDIAGHVGLSPSALHHHFKAVTGTTPVQFQKQLRLLEARRLIQSDARTITDAAHQVGYASPTQFSREYRRTFGRPPSSDRPSLAAR